MAPKKGEDQSKPKSNPQLKGERNLVARLIKFTLQELREADGKPYQLMGEEQQDEIIQRARKNAEEMVAEMVALAAGGSALSRVIVTLKTVSVKDKVTDIKMQVKTGTQGIHDMVTAQGEDVVVLIGADPADYGVGADGVVPEKDQRPLLT